MFYHPDDDPQKSTQQVAWGALILFMLAISILVIMIIYLIIQNKHYVELVPQGKAFKIQ